MTKYELDRMSNEKYRDMLIDYAYDDVNFVTNITKGHSVSAHINKDDYSLMSRSFKENIPCSTSFYDVTTFSESITDALVFMADDITDWMMSSRLDIEDVKDYSRLAFSLDLRGDDIGYGFKNKSLDRETTTGIRIVLTRDFNDDSPLGFYLTTAYPDLQFSKGIDKTYSVEDLLNAENRSMTVQEKLYTYALKNDIVEGVINNKNEKQSVKFRFKLNDEEQIIARFNENGLTIKRIDDESVKRISLEEVKEINSSVHEIIRKLNNQYNLLMEKEKEYSER